MLNYIYQTSYIIYIWIKLFPAEITNILHNLTNNHGMLFWRKLIGKQPIWINLTDFLNIFVRNVVLVKCVRSKSGHVIMVLVMIGQNLNLKWHGLWLVPLCEGAFWLVGITIVMVVSDVMRENVSLICVILVAFVFIYSR